MTINFVNLKLISFTLIISLLISDFLFCGIVNQLIELVVIIMLLLASIFLTDCCSWICYFNVLLTQFFTVSLYFISYFILGNTLFKETLVFILLFSIIIFIMALIKKRTRNGAKTRNIFIDFFLIFLGISLYFIISSNTKFRLLKFYHLLSILYMQLFFVYPFIFIIKVIYMELCKSINMHYGTINKKNNKGL